MAVEPQQTTGSDGAALHDAAWNVDIEVARLIDLCGELDIVIDEHRAKRLITYLAIVLEKNKVLNLTAVREWDKAVVLHLVDSLTLLPELDAQPIALRERPFLDMGCGAGFPGIPLALVRPERCAVLCDSVKKKIKAVDEFIKALGLEEQLSTTTDRLETLGMHHRREFGCIVVRAVASLPVLIEYAAPLLSKRGQLVVSKGVPSTEELQKGRKAGEMCGLEVLSERVFDLPLEYGQRTIITYEKVKEPVIRLPRSIGTATKQPLA